jgi:hypothetical protein
MLMGFYGIPLSDGDFSEKKNDLICLTNRHVMERERERERKAGKWKEILVQ